MADDPFAEDAIKVEAKKRLFGKRPKDPKEFRSSICAALWGLHDSLKSGIAMACRSEEQIERGEKVIIIDLDDANEPLWKEHWNMSEDILVVNPLVWTVEGDDEDGEKKEIDYNATLAMMHELVVLASEGEKKGNMVFAGIIFDGTDSLLDSAEQVMRDHHDIEIDEGAHFAMWKRRNKIYNDLIFATKSLMCAKYFITHARKHEKKKNDKIIKEWEDGDWEKKFPNKMWQVVLCEKEMDIEDGTTKYYATITKFKGHPELIGQKFTTMEIEDGKANFLGLPVLRDTHNWNNSPGKKATRTTKKDTEVEEEDEGLFD